MSSRKPSAKAKKIEEFKEQLYDTYEEKDPFAAENARQIKDSKKREEAKRKRACQSKNRYATRTEALDAIESCSEYGTEGLHYYQCPYCNGWHLTSKKQKEESDQ